MAKHKYDGKWRYFENPDGGDDVFTQGREMKLTIPAEDGIVDKANSSHNGEEVSGNARKNGVTLSRKRTGNTRTLHGTTMFEVPLSSGDVFVVIMGRFIDDGLELKTQMQGDWIITKP